MPVDSLVNLSLRACCKIHKQIKDIGPVLPYNVARPFLLKLDNPEQLHALEIQSPQIIGHDAEIWLAMIKRDIPNWEARRHKPNDPKDWWKVYRKLKRDSALEMDAGADMLKAALNDKNEKRLAEIKPLKALATSRRPSLQARVAYGYQSGKTGSRGSSKMGVLEKIKKEARDAKAARAIAEQQIRKRMTTAVTRAPAQFVEDVRTQRRKEQQSPERVVRASNVPITNRRAEASVTASPRTKSSPSRAAVAPPLLSPALSYQQVQEREARLRALK
jgi:elongin-A